MSLKNKWRRRGRLEFKRESCRYHDNTIWPGRDVLFIRVRRLACVFATYDKVPGVASGLWGNDGLYFSKDAVRTGKQLYQSVIRGL